MRDGCCRRVLTALPASDFIKLIIWTIELFVTATRINESGGDALALSRPHVAQTQQLSQPSHVLRSEPGRTF